MKAWTEKRKEDVKAAAKRHVVPVGIFIVGFLALLYTGNPEWRDAFFKITLTGLPEATLKISLYILTLVFVFPKIRFQDEITKGNISAGILAGALAIAICNIF
jgi:hypothetical protein